MPHSPTPNNSAARFEDEQHKPKRSSFDSIRSSLNFSNPLHRTSPTSPESSAHPLPRPRGASLDSSRPSQPVSSHGLSEHFRPIVPRYCEESLEERMHRSRIQERNGYSTVLRSHHTRQSVTREPEDRHLRKNRDSSDMPAAARRSHAHPRREKGGERERHHGVQLNDPGFAQAGRGAAADSDTVNHSLSALAAQIAANHPPPPLPLPHRSTHVRHGPRSSSASPRQGPRPHAHPTSPVHDHTQSIANTNTTSNLKPHPKQILAALARIPHIAALGGSEEVHRRIDKDYVMLMYERGRMDEDERARIQSNALRDDKKDMGADRKRVFGADIRDVGIYASGCVLLGGTGPPSRHASFTSKSSIHRTKHRRYSESSTAPKPYRTRIPARGQEFPEECGEGDQECKDCSVDMTGKRENTGYTLTLPTVLISTVEELYRTGLYTPTLFMEMAHPKRLNELRQAFDHESIPHGVIVTPRPRARERGLSMRYGSHISLHLEGTEDVCGVLTQWLQSLPRAITAFPIGIGEMHGKGKAKESAGSGKETWWVDVLWEWCVVPGSPSSANSERPASYTTATPTHHGTPSTHRRDPSNRHTYDANIRARGLGRHHHDAATSDTIRATQLLLQLLPTPHLDILIYLMAFFTQVVRLSEVHGFGIQKVARLIGGPLFGEKERSPASVGSVLGIEGGESVGEKDRRAQVIAVWFLNHWDRISRGLFDVCREEHQAPVVGSPKVRQGEAATAEPSPGMLRGGDDEETIDASSSYTYPKDAAGNFAVTSNTTKRKTYPDHEHDRHRDQKSERFRDGSDRRMKCGAGHDDPGRGGGGTSADHTELVFDEKHGRRSAPTTRAFDLLPEAPPTGTAPGEGGHQDSSIADTTRREAADGAAFKKLHCKSNVEHGVAGFFEDRKLVKSPCMMGGVEEVDKEVPQDRQRRAGRSQTEKGKNETIRRIDRVTGENGRFEEEREETVDEMLDGMLNSFEVVDKPRSGLHSADVEGIKPDSVRTGDAPEKTRPAETTSPLNFGRKCYTETIPLDQNSKKIAHTTSDGSDDLVVVSTSPTHLDRMKRTMSGGSMKSVSSSLALSSRLMDIEIPADVDDDMRGSDKSRTLHMESYLHEKRKPRGHLDDEVESILHAKPPTVNQKMRHLAHEVLKSKRARRSTGDDVYAMNRSRSSRIPVLARSNSLSHSTDGPGKGGNGDGTRAPDAYAHARKSTKVPRRTADHPQGLPTSLSTSSSMHTPHHTPGHHRTPISRPCRTPGFDTPSRSKHTAHVQNLANSTDRRHRGANPSSHDRTQRQRDHGSADVYGQRQEKLRRSSVHELEAELERVKEENAQAMGVLESATAHISMLEAKLREAALD